MDGNQEQPNLQSFITNILLRGESLDMHVEEITKLSAQTPPDTEPESASSHTHLLGYLLDEVLTDVQVEQHNDENNDGGPVHMDQGELDDLF